MNKFAFLLTFPLLLAGCVDNGNTEEEKAPTEPERNVITISQVFPDGSEKILAELVDSGPIDEDTYKKTTDESEHKPETTPPPAPELKRMAITPVGFEPSELTIKVGTTIIFENMDDKKHWPASGIHPIHEICKGFDALRPLEMRETYEYTFTKAETCPLHDHLRPSWTGTITIVE